MCNSWMWITVRCRIGEFVLTIVWDVYLTERLILWVVIARPICLQLLLRFLMLLTYKNCYWTIFIFRLSSESSIKLKRLLQLRKQSWWCPLGLAAISYQLRYTTARRRGRPTLAGDSRGGEPNSAGNTRSADREKLHS